MATAPQQLARRPAVRDLDTNGPADAAALNRRSRPPMDAMTPVNQNGCFEFDRVLKSGSVQKRTRKTKSWKTVHLVLRHNAISIYKNSKECKLRHQIYLSDLSAVTFLKDPKGKRKNLFGLFSSSRNFHFEAPSAKDAQEWVELIRTEARLEEEEEEMFLNGPGRRSMSPVRPPLIVPGSLGHMLDSSERLSMMPCSPEHQKVVEPPHPPLSTIGGGGGGHRRFSSTLESSGLSGNEMPSYSDWSDVEPQRLRWSSYENLPTQEPAATLPGQRLHAARQSLSQNVGGGATAEQEPERVIWQGWLWRLQSKGGVRQWKDMWGVLRGRNLILYKNASEYAAQWIVDVADVVDVVDIDPLSKSKVNCLQIITEEKSYRFCAHDEESLVQFMGAFKSLLAKRRSMGGRVGKVSL